MKVLEFLGGKPAGNGEWHYDLGRELHGAFGGANGGVVGAVCVNVARSLSPGRAPASLDVRFIRGLTEGTARVVPVMLHEGRTLSVISVDIFDSRGKLCTRATVSMANLEALEPFEHAGFAGVPEGWKSYADGKPWAKPGSGVEVPLIDTFGPRLVGNDARGYATEVKVHWDEPGTCAEAACIAADISVGPPVGSALGGRPIPIPNPDLTLRFCAEPPLPRTMISACRLEHISRGIASTRIEVRAGSQLVAIGVSTTTLLAGAWPDARKPKIQD